MKKTSVVFVLLSTLIVISCKREQEQTNTLPSYWSSFRPETIPFRIRQQNLERGNIVPNSSFESGKLYGIESEQEAFNAPGWRRSGTNVFWVNIKEELFDSSEVSTGIHAIKIAREKSDETEDTGEGVISDFIKVIPGQYNLSLDIKLQNIKSSKSRLGTKLYDAIDIRVIYYDKNKIEISPNQYSNHYQTNINTSYKWLSFAHFNRIDSLDWTTVFCESAYPPFPDGYVPDETRFIKIFVGLKGSGTMWVDNINYSYTKNNFSLQERLEPYSLKEFDTYDLILPSPHIILKKNKISLTQDSTKKEILLLYPKNSSVNKSVDFSNLNNKISKYNVNISNTIANKKIEDYNLILSLGNTDIFKSTFSDSIFIEVAKNRTQSYIIKSVEKLPNIVFVSSKTEIGLQYAISTTEQLLDSSNNIFYNADITDWPDLTERSVTINSKIEEKILENLVTDLRFTKIFTKNINGLPKTNHGFILDKISILKGHQAPKDRSVLIKTQLTSSPKTNLTNKEKIWYCEKCCELENLNQIDPESQNAIHHANNLDFDAMIWKGTSSYSPFIDLLDYNRIKEYTNLSIVLSLSLDNYPYEIPVNTNNLLTLPNLKISGTIFENIQHINFEIDSLNLVNQLKILAMSYYTWNTEDYNSDELLYKILVKKISHQGDIAKLISLADNLKMHQWKNYSNRRKNDTINQKQYFEIIGNNKFEDKKLDSLIMNNIKLITEN